MSVSPTRWCWIYFDVLKKRSSLCSCLKPREPVKTTVWIKLEAAAVMPSLCVYLRRGILRRYRQVPRTEADGAFNYSRAVNRRGLLNSGVCGCCGPLRPRYKRLVDNIFPEDPKLFEKSSVWGLAQDGLSKSDMEKLTFYAVSAPEKLDRIGAYLAERLSRDVVRHRYGYVVIAMEALDQLLMACHSQSIKPFVESFLHMVAKLLESREPDLQVLGTNSFVKFANIEEDTPSYHRRYDFFVSQFSAMCHSTHEDTETRTRWRGIPK
ncbi:Protein EFR3 -like protein A [Collichthys lucidus]|uniref:Protein EFR3-like protein A n=1 Tax=Collichthys lucidus TaxID=240159 RepID=A0A4U5UX43_COLLU|nr:Protein EFR3 -like protein A [Collichthys lucidus]